MSRRKNKNLQEMYPAAIGSLTSMARKVPEVKEKRVIQHSIFQARLY